MRWVLFENILFVLSKLNSLVGTLSLGLALRGEVTSGMYTPTFVGVDGGLGVGEVGRGPAEDEGRLMGGPEVDAGGEEIGPCGAVGTGVEEAGEVITESL